LNQLIHLDSSFHLEVFGGAAVRRVIDMAHPDSSWNVLPTGQSGNPISKHYKDQADVYYTGKLRPQWMSIKRAAKEAGNRTIHLVPSN
jgi:penicillin amidase